MVAYYPLAPSARIASRRRSIRRLHAFLPFDHVDHLHPDWAIALAASANGTQKLAEFNQQLRPQHRVGALAAPGL